MTDHCTIATSRAIDRSIAEGAIVTVEHTDTLAIELHEACDGDVYDAARNRHEYWGAVEVVDGERSEWRVHLSGASR